MVSKSLMYSLVASAGRHLLIASDRIEALKETLGDLEILAELSGGFRSEGCV